MTVILVKGFGKKVCIKDYLKSIINGKFRIMKIVNAQDRICFVKLSKQSDPNDVIRKIELSRKPPYMNIHASIPVMKANSTTLNSASNKVLKKYALHTLLELQKELQIKYNKLFIISLEDGHKLLNAVSEVIIDRLKTILISHINHLSDPSTLSRLYRLSHPHDTDMALLQTVSDQVKDELGEPPTVLIEEDLIHMSKEPNPKTYPFSKVMKTAMKFTRDITKKVETYIQNLPSDPLAVTDPTNEQIARIHVRRELKNVAPYLNLMVQQIVNKHWTLHNTDAYQIRIYGEPYLPRQFELMDLFKKFDVKNYSKCPNVYNMATLKVREQMLPELLQMDGTVIDGAKVVIRPIPVHLHLGAADIGNRLLHFIVAMKTSGGV